VALGLLLFGIGGLPFLLWGIFLRTVVGLHATWLVNSATHVWGSRPFSTRDDSTNNWFVALLTFGEGWHNNHHAHPSSARHGLKWYEIDMNWYGIWVLKVFGLAKQITIVRPDGSDRKEIFAGSHVTKTSIRHLQSAAGD
jgi:stearoyl-CoA desaturase (delta-9 desaturase)